MDKRIEVVHQQNTALNKTKDLCNIYGQTFTSINFGNASYSPGLSKFENLGPIKSKSKNYSKAAGHSRNANINADLLQPLLAISKDSLGDNFTSPNHSNDNNAQDISTVLHTFDRNGSNKASVKINKLNL